ncbi:hypothetical protein CPA54_02615 [Parasaccharibacter sp. TMW2.1890]|nr:hypothetical protein [Parasaccharibacter sp. TMW2.1890]
MAFIALSVAARKKLKRRLEKHAGLRLRGSVTIEARVSVQGRRLARSFSDSSDIFTNLDAAIAWQAVQKASQDVPQGVCQPVVSPPDPVPVETVSSSSPFAEWTVADLLRKFGQYHIEQGKVSYVSHISSFLKRWKNLPLVQCKLGTLRAVHIRQFRESMKERGLCAATINKRIGLIEVAINFLNREHDAELTNYASSDYVAHIKNADKRRSRRVSDEELTLILRHFKGPTARHAAALICFCFHQGTRRSEAFNMTWGDVDFDNHAIRFPKHKTMNYDQELGGQVRVMTGKARDLLLRLREEAGRVTASQKVFNAYARVDGYSLAFRRATKEAGLEDIRLHDLRHEATTRIAALCGHNTSLIKRVTGHRDDASLARYTHTSTNSIAMLMSRNAIQHE